MKSIVVLSALLFTLASCDRASDNNTSRITVTLPNSNPSGSMSTNKIENSPLASNLQTSNVSSQNSGIAETDGLNNTYLEIIPRFITGAKRPVNCYMIAVTGPEKAMQVNRCSFSSNAATGIKNVKSFGTYMGLRPSGATLTLDVPAGEARQVQIYAFHATAPESCVDLSLNPSRATLSHPFLVGQSVAQTFEPGKEITVDVNMVPPSDLNKIEDCAFVTDGESKRLANSIGFDLSVFPYGNLNYKYQYNGTTTCEALDISLYSNMPKSIPGVLPIDYTGKVMESNTPRPIFGTFASCLAGTLPMNGFKIPAGESTARVWVRLANESGDPGFTIENVTSISIDTSTSVGAFHLSPDPVDERYVFDITAPARMVPGECYPFTASYRTLYGETPTPEPAATTIPVSITNENGSTSMGLVYPNANCSSTGSSILSIPFAVSSTTTSVMSFKLNPSIPALVENVFLRVAPNIVGSKNIDGFKTPIAVDAATVSYTPSLTRIRENVSDKLYTLESSTPSVCLPVNLGLQDQRGRNWAATALDTLAVVSGSVTANNVATNAITFFKNRADCFASSNVVVPEQTVAPDVGMPTQTIYARIPPAVRSQKLSFKIRVNTDLVHVINLNRDLDN